MKFKVKKDGLNDEQVKAVEQLINSIDIEGAMTKEEIAKAVTDKLSEMGVSKDNIDSISKQMNEDNPEGVASQIKVLSKKIDDMAAKAEKSDMGGYTPKLLTNDEFEAIKTAIKEQKRSHEVLLKAPAIMTTANFITNAPHSRTMEIDRSINSAPAPEMVIYDRLVKSSTNASIIYWTNRVNEEGGAAFIAEGALKPLKDWERTEANSVAKKVVVIATVTTEALEDVYQLEQEINEVLREEVIKEIADAILNSIESGTALKGIIPVATSYTTTALDDKVEMPNMADAIRAGMLQLRLLRFNPTVVFLNPGDAALLDLTKDANGQYIKLQIDGVLQKIDVVETTEIAAGKFLLMDENKWKIRIYKGITTRWGYNEDDFSHNRISVVFEARLHSYINSLDLGAVLYGDFATIIAAIEKPAAV